MAFSLILIVALGFGSGISHLGHPALIKAAPTTPTGRFFDYVVVIILERKGFNEINATSAPYLTQLAGRSALAVNYTSLSSVTVSNYLALTAGSTFNLASSPTPSTYSLTVANIADRMEAAGLTWKAYIEAMPQPCYATNNSKYQNYTVRHNPFVYFTDITNNTARCSSHVVPGNSTSNVPSYWNLLSDLSSTATASNFMWLTPNLCNDMSTGTCGVPAGDHYLSVLVPRILNSTLFKTQRSALLITFGQGNGAASYPTAYVYTVWAGNAAKQQFKTNTFYTHYSFLATFEYNWGLPSLGLNDTRASPMTEFFTVTSGGLSATLSYSPTATIVNQQVTFTASVTGGAIPYAYFWSFGDGGTSTANPATHTYIASGSFSVKVNATDANGVKATSSQSISVAPVPTVSFTPSPTSPEATSPVTFTATPSGGVGPFGFSWSFGDGGTSTVNPAIHTYTASGAFTVKLNATDVSGVKATSSQSITVAPALGVSFTKSPLSPEVTVPETFTATTTGGVGAITFSWSFGDGSPQSTTNPATHTYTSTGSFTVTLRVTDASSKIVTVTNAVTVVSGLAADFTFSPTNPAVGDMITFTATQTGGTSPFTYSWNFGDGSAPGTGRSASHAYGVKGTFTVTLTVTDSTLPISQTVTVSDSIVVTPQPLTASFTLSSNPAASTPVTFTATVSGGTSPYSYAWNFGETGTGLTNPASHIYNTQGTFTVTLTVIDSNATVTTVSQAIIVAQPPLAATFTVSANPTVASPLTFTATATGGTSPYAYAWKFGDGSSGSGQIAAHTYASTGSYAVTLTVQDSSATPQSTTTSLTIIVTPDFTINASPTTLSFTAGQSGTSSVHLSSLGFTGSINLTVAVSPAARGLTTSLSVNSGSLITGGTVSLVLIVASATSTETATYTVTVTGSGTGVPSHSASITVTVKANLTISAGPTSLVTLPAGGSTTSTISISSLGFSGLVFLAATVVPANGPTTSLSVNPIFLTLGSTVSFALTITATTSMPAGHYQIAVTATGGFIRAYTTETVDVIPTLNTPVFTVTPTSPAQGETISLSGSASGGVPPYNYTWSFGDGTAATGRTVTHLYPAGGNYMVTLIVTDPDGQRIQASTRILVTNPPDLAELSFFGSMVLPVVAFGTSVLVILSIIGLYPSRKKSMDDDSVQAAWQE